MKELLTSLAEVQTELKAPKNQRNNFGNYNYRSAEDILEAVKPLVISKGLVMTISDQVVLVGERYYVEATVTVQNATDSIKVTAMAREAEDKKGMDDAQITGAASSYARKYALNGMFNIDDTKDADTDEHQKQSPRTDEVNQDLAAKITSTAKKLGYSDNEIKAKLASIRSEKIALLALDKLESQLNEL